MPTVVDALVVTLGLDGSQFAKGAKEAQAQTQKFREGVTTMGKTVTEHAKKAADGLSALRGQVLMLFAAFAAGKGLQQFTSDVIAHGAALGRMASMLGTTTGELGKWQGIAKATGGTAEGVTGAIRGLNESLKLLSLTGQSDIIPFFRALQQVNPTLSLTNAKGQIKDVMELLNDPEFAKAMRALDPATRSVVGHGLHLDDSLINYFGKSAAEQKKMQDDQKRWGIATEAQAKAAQNLQYNINGVRQAFEHLGDIILERIEPGMTWIIKHFQDLYVEMQKHPQLLEMIASALIGIGVAIAALTAAPLLAAFFNPIVLAIAAVSAGLTYLFLDWSQWMAGGKSDFGEFYQFVEDGWKKIEEAAKETWNNVKSWVLPVINALKDVFGDWIKFGVDQLKFLYDVFFGTSDDIKKDWETLTSDLKKLWTDLWGGLATAVTNAGPHIFAAVKKAFGDAFDWVISIYNKLADAFGWNKIGPSGESASGSSSSSGAIESGDSTGGKGATVGSAEKTKGGTSSGAIDSSSWQTVDIKPQAANSNRDAFIKKYYADAKRVSDETGIPVERILGQAGLETGWNVNAPGNNLFGVKATSDWKGKVANLQTQEQGPNGLYTTTQPFRVYDNAGDSFKDHMKVLMQKNFIGALQPGISDAEYARRLKAGGYATDADYAAKVVGAINAAKAGIAASGVAGGTAGPAVPKANPNPPAITPLPVGGPTAAAASGMRAGAVDNSISKSQQTHIENQNIYTNATDGAGIAKDIKPAMERGNFAVNANDSFV